MAEPSRAASVSHVCDDRCAHTVVVGYVHTPDDQGVCLPACPHPDHRPAVYGWDDTLPNGDGVSSG